MTWLDLEDGNHIQYCEDCKTSMGDPAQHTWDQNGDTEVHTCTVCSVQEAHIWKLNKETDTAKCEEPGEGTYRCINCEATKVDETPAKGHAYDNTWHFTEDLMMHYQICSRCNDDSLVQKEPHTFEYVEREDDNVCTKCGLPHDFATGYSHKIQSVISGTCSKLVYMCECGNTLTKVGEPGEFEDYHVFEDGLCRECGADDPNYGTGDNESGEHEHQWGDWVVTIEPTEDEEGEKECACETCGKIQTMEIPMLEHTCVFNNPTDDYEEPTCDEPGYQVMACRCGESIEIVIDPTNKHEPEDAGTDCTHQYYVCSVCGTAWDEPLSEPNHKWDEDGFCTECGTQHQSLFHFDYSFYNSKRRNYV